MIKVEHSANHAIWPKHREIITHLQFRPWIFLPAFVPAKKCLVEAMNLLEKFVEHRAYDQVSQNGAKWKSLALKAVFGDSKKTESHTQYGASEADYQFTEMAQNCPQTMHFLAGFTDLQQCERVRFMLLEPGAEIAVHSDAPHKECSLAVNIAFNMPSGCEFWTGLNPDGSHNKYSQKIPIQDGAAFIFNTATYHRVFNHSSTPRMHLILHGPLRFSEAQIIQAARIQNGHSTFEEIQNALVDKKQSLMQKEATFF